ncbi:MAG: heparinase II/III family protein [Aestuariivirgaceae bacterium]
MNSPRVATISAPVHVTGLLDLGFRRIAARMVRHFSGSVAMPMACRATGAGLPVIPLMGGDADQALALYKGRFQFGGTAIECSGRVIFEHQVPDDDWTAQLHGFAWLSAMRAGGRELYRVQARALVQDWISRNKTLDRRAWRTRTLARRIICWIVQAEFLLDDAPNDFQRAFLSSLGRQVRRLMRGMAGEPNRRARLDAAIALNYACLGLAGMEPLRATAYGRLARELNGQILPDGGHVSRNPTVLLDVLHDLLPLRSTLQIARLEVPGELNEALERMVPMLRFFCHDDGGLAVFNGVRHAAAGRAMAVLAADTVCGRPLVHATHSGYCRLAHANSRVIVDTGRPPAPGLNDAAASSPLAFEFSDGPYRLVVNCGTPQAGDDAWSDAARLTAAHSTVSIGEKSAGVVLAGRLMRRIFGTPVIMGPQTIDGRVSSDAQGSVLDAEHDGYMPQLGIAHHRRLFLSSDGKDLRGEDRFTIDLEQPGDITNVPFAARFHIHPSVKVTLSQDSGSVMLMLPNKTGWRFSARGGRLKLEDSVYLPGGSGSRRCKQIVLEGIIGRPDRVQWAFKRIEKRKAQLDQVITPEPQLPL